MPPTATRVAAPVVLIVPKAFAVKEPAPPVPFRPATLNAPLARDTGAESVTAPPAQRFSPPLPMLVMFAPASTVMDVVAFSVRLDGVPQLMGVLTVMLPVPVPALALASTMTFERPSWVCSVPVFRFDVVAAVSESVIVNVVLLKLIPVSSAFTLIVISVGSSSKVPVTPNGARVSTRPLKAKVCLPDVSTKPPSPPFAPPRAAMLPWKVVLPSDQTTTWPPLPLSVALALMRALAPTTVWLAVGTSPAPCSAPPTSTVPPPAAPNASIVALPKRPTRSPSTLMSPPRSPVAAPLASSLPETWVIPLLPPSITMLPLRCPMDRACTTPSRLSTVSAKPARATARISAMPPSAFTLPSRFNLVCKVPSLRGLKKINPSPSRSSCTSVAASSPTRGASMRPVCVSCGATMTTLP